MSKKFGIWKGNYNMNLLYNSLSLLWIIFVRKIRKGGESWLTQISIYNMTNVMYWFKFLFRKTHYFYLYIATPYLGV